VIESSLVPDWTVTIFCSPKPATGPLVSVCDQPFGVCKNPFLFSLICRLQQDER
jgi:hypothetical protein